MRIESPKDTHYTSSLIYTTIVFMSSFTRHHKQHVSQHYSTSYKNIFSLLIIIIQWYYLIISQRRTCIYTHIYSLIIFQSIRNHHQSIYPTLTSLTYYVLIYKGNTRVGNRPGRPTGAYGLVCLSLACPGLFIKKARLMLFKKSI